MGPRPLDKAKFFFFFFFFFFLIHTPALRKILRQPYFDDVNGAISCCAPMIRTSFQEIPADKVF